MRKRTFHWLLVPVLTIPLTIGIAVTAYAEEPFCYDCHDELPKATHAHDPVDSGDCTACHEDHGEAEELRLVEEGSALCYQCHDELVGEGSLHPPVEDGECTACHNPHGSDNLGLLAAVAPELCHNCHDAKNEGASVHPPVEDGECSECHEPHGSDHGSLLVAESKELCFNCHDDMSFSFPVIHDAVEEGCSECHSPHSSQHERLLTANLSLERSGIFDESQAELCFNCHEVDAFKEASTEDTDFRQGLVNLHQLHLAGGAKPNKYGFVKKKPGQTCLGCHLPHSTLQERLVRKEFQCKGVFCYTMRFTPNNQGGTCVVGCHKSRTYSRDTSQEDSQEEKKVVQSGK